MLPDFNQGDEMQSQQQQTSDELWDFSLTYKLSRWRLENFSISMKIDLLFESIIWNWKTCSLSRNCAEQIVLSIIAKQTFDHQNRSLQLSLGAIKKPSEVK